MKPFENAVIQCKATGDEPITITWHPENREMPPSVYTSEGYLQFRGIQVSDAGKYRCRAVNPAGEADAVAEVIVDGKFSSQICIFPSQQCYDFRKSTEAYGIC